MTYSLLHKRTLTGCELLWRQPAPDALAARVRTRKDVELLQRQLELRQAVGLPLQRRQHCGGRRCGKPQQGAALQPHCQLHHHLQR